MEPNSTISLSGFGGIALVIFLIVYFLGAQNTIIPIYKAFTKRFINPYLFYVDLKPKYKTILQEHFLYYRLLSKENQHIFKKRLAKFLALKEFVPRGELTQVSDEMKTLIGASAIQITFGHPHVYFEQFERILVYPDAYYSEITQRYHYGEVNPRGFIILSWKNFIEGYLNHDNGRNLGLHEMAHALHIENSINNEEYDFLDFDILKMWNRMALDYIDRIRDGENSFFRDYGGTNRHEFFAVMIENFFERPAQFKEYDPDLYRVACGLMNQDPLLLLPAS